MADTTFVDKKTVVQADWLNDVNDVVYTDLGGVGGIGSSTGSSKVGHDGQTVADYFKNKVDRVVNSIVELKTVDKTKYTKVLSTGYYANGDGGAGEYYYDSADITSSDNGGTIIVASDSGRWKLIHTGNINLKQFGARTSNTDAQNKTILQTSITAINGLGGGVITVDYDISYGVKTRTSSTWPDFTGTTKPIAVEDFSRGTTQDPNVYPTSYDGMQYRLWTNTPQTTSPGQHDGNTQWLRGSWAPVYCVSNDANLAAVGNPARNALDNRRAGYATMIDGSAAWQLIQGTRNGAGLTNEELSNIAIQKFSAPGDTLADYTPWLVERKTSYQSHGGGRNLPKAHHHFEPASVAPGNYLMLWQETGGARTRTVWRAPADEAGTSDVMAYNDATLWGLNTPAGDAIQLNIANRRIWIPGSLQLRRNSPTYGTTITIDPRLGNIFTISATNATAFAIAAPSDNADSQQITITIKNTSGGALGAATWNAVYKMAAWTQPANGFSRSISFYCDGTNWIEYSRTTADIPN